MDRIAARLTAALAPAVLIAALAQDAGAPLAIGRAPPKAGDAFKIKTSVTNDVRATLTVGGSALPEIRHVVKSERTATAVVKSVDAAGASALEIKYTDATAIDDLLSENPSREPFADETYAVARNADGSLRAEHLVKDSAGAVQRNEATPADRSVLSGDAAPLLLAASLFECWSANRLAPGAKVSVPPALARRLLPSELAAMEVKSLELVVSERSRDAECVAFAATLRLEDQGEPKDDLPIETTGELHGELLVGRAHGRLVEVNLQGTLTMHGALEQDGLKKEIRGTGALEWRSSVRPSE